jgi:hypothetical protein
MSVSTLCLIALAPAQNPTSNGFYPDAELGRRAIGEMHTLAIRSLTLPPTERYSGLATKMVLVTASTALSGIHTEVALESLLLGNAVEADEGGVSNGIESRVEDAPPVVCGFCGHCDSGGDY